MYHGHDVVERCFNQLKDWRGLDGPRLTSAGMSFRMAGYDPFW
jgi:hypothetical protein